MGREEYNFNFETPRAPRYSIVLHLRDCPRGGGTRFYSDAQRNALVRDAEGRFTGLEEHAVDLARAKKGRAVFFYHNHMHEGEAVGAGCGGS